MRAVKRIEWGHDGSIDEWEIVMGRSMRCQVEIPSKGEFSWRVGINPAGCRDEIVCSILSVADGVDPRTDRSATVLQYVFFLRRSCCCGSYNA